MGIKYFRWFSMSKMVLNPAVQKLQSDNVENSRYGPDSQNGIEFMYVAKVQICTSSRNNTHSLDSFQCLKVSFWLKSSI